MRRVLILAENYAQAGRWAREENIPAHVWRYVGSEQDIIGCRDVYIAFAPRRHNHPQAAFLDELATPLIKWGFAREIKSGSEYRDIEALRRSYADAMKSATTVNESRETLELKPSEPSPAPVKPNPSKWSNRLAFAAFAGTLGLAILNLCGGDLESANVFLSLATLQAVIYLSH